MDDLLKEAIADAKAVRETALENAKMALEEAFTPRLQSMLSKKIQTELEDEEEDAMDEPVGDDEEEEMDEEERVARHRNMLKEFKEKMERDDRKKSSEVRRNA